MDDSPDRVLMDCHLPAFGAGDAGSHGAGGDLFVSPGEWHPVESSSRAGPAPPGSRVLPCLLAQAAGSGGGEGGALEPPGPALDEGSFAELLELGEDSSFACEIVEDFLAEAASRLEELRAGARAADLARIEKAAHALKSASASVGALRFSALCRELEELSRSGTTAGTAELVARVEEELGRVEAALAGKVAELGG